MKQGEYKFTIRRMRAIGTTVDGSGNVIDFVGYLGRSYQDLKYASIAARRKYADPMITVLELEPVSKSYTCDYDQLMSISKEI